MTYAAFFLSTGRCGTQWLAKQLAETYADCAVVEHEPLKRDYLPRQLLATRDSSRWPNAALIQGHVTRVEQELATKSYIECGWPCFGALPHLIEQFKGRVRIVHLTRHPIPTASSMITHRYYKNPPREDGLDGKALMTPFDPGVAFTAFRDRWERMDRLEKCLYFWAEVNALGLRLEREQGVPWLRLKSESLFEGDGIELLLDFLELPRREAIYSARSQSVDKWHHQTDETLDTNRIAEHPEIMAVADELGYEALGVDAQQIRKRYKRDRPGRSPCPCGSGKQYMYCHGRSF